MELFSHCIFDGSPFFHLDYGFVRLILEGFLSWTELLIKICVSAEVEKKFVIITRL